MEKNSYGVYFSLDPWTEDIGFRITKIHLIEKWGGFIPTGEIELWHSGEPDALDLITTQNTGTLTIKDTKDKGLEYKIPFFIISRQFFKNTLKLKVICIQDRKFFTVPVITSYDDISNALKALYPGEIDIRVESDINNDKPIHQWGETNYEFCNRLATSFKKNSIFAYSWSGFILKDLMGEKDSFGNTEPKLVMSDLYLKQSTPYSLVYNKYLNYEPYNTWENKIGEIKDDIPNIEENGDFKDLEFTNGHILKNYESYNFIGTDYEQFLDNYLYNSNLLNSDLYSSFIVKMTDIPNYKLCDVFEYQMEEQESSYPFKYFIVSSNEVFYTQEGSGSVDSSGLSFSWTTTLLGVEKGDWTAQKDE